MSGLLTVPRRVRVVGGLYHGRIPDGAVYVGRAAPGLPASPYANPYPVKEYGLDRCRDLFRQHVADSPLLVAAARAELGGKDLACWCPDNAPWCHADEWLALANPGWTRPEPAQGALW